MTKDGLPENEYECRAMRLTGRWGSYYYFKGVRWHGPSNTLGMKPYKLEADGFHPGQASYDSLARELWKRTERALHV